MRFVLFFLFAVTACEIAPAESADDVVARENARVAAAKDHAVAKDQQDRADADRKKQADADARAAAEQARADQQRHDKETACATDRTDRRAHFLDAITRAAREKARSSELEAYVARSCQRKDVTDYKNEQYVDDKGFTQTRQIAAGKHEEIACPADAPPELRPGGGGFPSGVVSVSADERAKNDRCQDVQDLLRK